MPLLIPLQAVPNQALTVSLGGQLCQINVYYKPPFGIFCDIYVNNVLIIAGVLCLNLNLIVRSLYLGFLGDVYFWDTQGTSDPVYTGLGARYQLVYYSVDEIAALNLPYAPNEA